ncbi:SDR family oxidoreductase, partial [Microbacterium sp. ISL-103]|uniref:SDR family oxidoreductase n=1 Tax=Microbacterium sp. ISL-103 TaxID=2819156 RepID=UPI002034E7B7
MNSAPSPKRLDGRRIVITGAASGIGRATAQRFVDEGAEVALLDRDETGVTEAARTVGGYAFTVDITDDASVADALARAAERLGGIDGLVNAAGVMFRGPIAEVSAEQWRRVIDINLTGAYIVCRAALPYLAAEESATVVNIAS